MGFLGALGNAAKGAAGALAGGALGGGAVGGAVKGALGGGGKKGVLSGIASAIGGAMDRDDDSHEGFGGQRLPGKMPEGTMSLAGKTQEVGRRKLRSKSFSSSRSVSGRR